MNAERLYLKKTLTPIPYPSMGPRSHERGEDARNLKLHMKFHPSMGPRSHERGELVILHFSPTSFFPSMGPRSHERGESAGKVAADALQALQWGRAHMNAESTYDGHVEGCLILPSMGPRSHERGELKSRTQ